MRRQFLFLSTISLLTLSACQVPTKQASDFSTQSSTASSDIESSIADTTRDEVVAGTGHIVSFDNTWKIYRHPSLAFSIKLPKAVEIAPNKPTSEVIVFEDRNNAQVFITTREHYDAILPSDPKPTTIHTLVDENASGYPPSWLIQRAEVEDEEDLTRFIRTNFGQGCSLGTLTPTDQPETLDVAIKGSEKDPGEAACSSLMANPAIRYQPSTGHVAWWTLGQDVRFVSGSDEGDQAYDMEMLRSFRFE